MIIMLHFCNGLLDVYEHEFATTSTSSIQRLCMYTKITILTLNAEKKLQQNDNKNKFVLHLKIPNHRNTICILKQKTITRIISILFRNAMVYIRRKCKNIDTKPVNSYKSFSSSFGKCNTKPFTFYALKKSLSHITYF